jgi:hypothetical protein
MARIVSYSFTSLHITLLCDSPHGALRFPLIRYETVASTRCSLSEARCIGASRLCSGIMDHPLGGHIWESGWLPFPPSSYLQILNAASCRKRNTEEVLLMLYFGALLSEIKST